MVLHLIAARYFGSHVSSQVVLAACVTLKVTAASSAAKMVLDRGDIVLRGLAL